MPEHELASTTEFALSFPDTNVQTMGTACHLACGTEFNFDLSLGENVVLVSNTADLYLPCCPVCSVEA
jgi:hypothetical protein